MKGTSSDVVPFGAGYQGLYRNVEWNGADNKYIIVSAIEDFPIDPAMILHGEQSLELLAGALPLEGRFTNKVSMLESCSTVLHPLIRKSSPKLSVCTTKEREPSWSRKQ